MLAPKSAGVPPIEYTEFTPPDPNLIPSFGLGPDLNTNNILWYFYNSPFNDQGSVNAAYIHWVAMNIPPGPQKDRIFGNRAVFEEELQKRYPVGVSFVVTEEPKAQGEPWVIQRQNRKYESVEGGGRRIVMEVEATYYTVGLAIRMATSLWDILNAKMVRAFALPLSSHSYTTTQIANTPPSSQQPTSCAKSMSFPNPWPPGPRRQATPTSRPRSRAPPNLPRIHLPAVPAASSPSTIRLNSLTHRPRPQATSPPSPTTSSSARSSSPKPIATNTWTRIRSPANPDPSSSHRPTSKLRRGEPRRWRLRRQLLRKRQQRARPAK